MHAVENIIEHMLTQPFRVSPFHTIAHLFLPSPGYWQKNEQRAHIIHSQQDTSVFSKMQVEFHCTSRLRSPRGRWLCVHATGRHTRKAKNRPARCPSVHKHRVRLPHRISRQQLYDEMGMARSVGNFVRANILTINQKCMIRADNVL